MNIITEQDKSDLMWAMKCELLDNCRNKCNKVQVKFIYEDATYEQLLNLCFNKNSINDYKSFELLESVAVSVTYDILKEGSNPNRPMFWKTGKYGIGTDQGALNDKQMASIMKRFDKIRSQANKWQDHYEETMRRVRTLKSGPQKDAAIKTARNSLDKYKELSKKAIEFRDRSVQMRKAADELSHKGQPSSMWDNMKKYFSSPEGKKILTYGGIALGGVAVGVAAYWLYKKYFSAAAKACANADNKSECIKKYKADAIKKTLTILKQNKSVCSKSKNPDKCIAKLDKQINKWQKKLNNLT